MSNQNPRNQGTKNSPASPSGRPAEVKSTAPATPAGPPTSGAVPPLFRGIDWAGFLVAAVLVFIGYWWTLAPDLTLEDSGELAVGSMYAGVPHPPGYPVWTVYSWFFTLLPFSNMAYRVALSSAVAGALSCGLVALMVSRGSSMIIEGIQELKAVERRWENALCMVSGFVAAMLIGFNGFMWSQAVIVEVYTLSVLSLAGVLACMLRWIYAPHQRRYLYLAFFWFGICFNNHQSLLVISIGMEVAIMAVAPRFGRNMFFWNTLIYLIGLAGKWSGLIGMLNDNVPLIVIYHFIGFGSLISWIVLAVKTKLRGVELVRDLVMVVSLGYIGALFLIITNFISAFEFKPGAFVLFNMVGVTAIGAFLWLIRETKKLSMEWLFTLICGAAWFIGAAFYFYMPVASMTNPPLNWGYPRTVAGFFHAFTRGQYERIHPTTEFGRFIEQIQMYIGGALDEFNLVYLLIGLLPLFFLKKMQVRERAWLIGLVAFYFVLSFFLLILLNPAPDRQSRDLNRVFFTASHVMIAMGIGYGLTILGAYLSTQYERFRKYALQGALGAAGVALLLVAITFQSEDGFTLHTLVVDLDPTYSPLVRFTTVFSLVLALAAVAVFYLGRTKLLAKPLLCLFCLMPAWSILSHWEENEQRGHLFGYWFGHDMFTPPFKGKDGKPLYPEMDRDTVLYGGTDPGRFNPTYMIFCESFTPPQHRRDTDRNFDRRDVYLITQNALADGTYLNYIRAHYNRSAQIDPPFFSELVRGPKELETNDSTNIVARMMRPLDRFFLKLGDDIEKNRRAGSSFFNETNYVDLASFSGKLKAGREPLSKYLFDQLSKETQQLLNGGGQDNALRRALSKDLNKVLEAGLLYDPARFAGIELTKRTQRFLKQNPQSHTRIRLNRLLLEEAYPKEITKSLGGVYPDLEIMSATNEDSQRAFQEYLGDAQKRLEHDRRFPNEPRQIKPGEDVKIIDNRVQVSGQVAVMAINGLLTKIIFDKNPDHEFYVEESFPLDWMYPHLSPFGIIMKINRQQLPELTQEIVDRDHEFWSQFSERLIGNWITYDTTVSNLCDFANQVYYRREQPKSFKGDWKFLRDSDGQKAFSKLRSSIAGVYNWRIANSKSPQEQQRMIKETEFAFKQAYAFCPYSPEAIFRYINLLVTFQRIDDALLLATTSFKLDPFNTQIEGLINELKRIKASMPVAGAPGAMTPPAAAPNPAAEIVALEAQFRVEPDNLPIGYRLAMAHFQMQQSEQGMAVLDRLVAHPKADVSLLAVAAQTYGQLGQIGRVEQCLAQLVKLSPDNPEGRFDLAAFQAVQNKSTQAVESLREALKYNASRRQRDPKANNLYSNALTDDRFASLRQTTQFQQLLDSYKAQ